MRPPARSGKDPRRRDPTSNFSNVVVGREIGEGPMTQTAAVECHVVQGLPIDPELGAVGAFPDQQQPISPFSDLASD